MNKQTKISAADCQLTISDIYTKYKTNLDIFIEKHYKINANDKPIKLLFNYMVRYHKNEEHFEKMLEDQFIEVFDKINVKNPRKKDLEDYNFRLKLLSEYVLLKRKNFFKGQTNLNFISFVRYTQDSIIKKINKVTYKSLTFNHMNVIGKTMNVSGMLEKSHIKLTNVIIHINLPKIAIIDLPVRHCKKYHGIFKDYKCNLNKTTGQKQYLIQISFDETKKEVKITLVRDIEKNVSDLKDKQILGVDVNTKHNIFALSNCETQKIDKNLVKKNSKRKEKTKRNSISKR